VVTDAPTVKLIKEREPDWNSFRIVSQSGFPFGKNTNLLNYPNVSMVRGLQSVNGYDALRLVRTTDIAGNMTLDGWVQELDAFNLNHQGFNLLNTKYLLTERATASGPEDSVTHAGIRFSSEPLDMRFEAGTQRQINVRTIGTELALVTSMGESGDVPDDTVILDIAIITNDGHIFRQELRAGRDTAEWAYDRADVKAMIKHKRPLAVESWPEAGFEGHRYLARLPFERAEIARIEFRYAHNAAAVQILRASLYDAETKISTPLDAVVLPPERWREVGSSGPVRVYENLKVLPRAWFVRSLKMSTTKEVLQAIKTGKFSDGTSYEPREVALFEKELYGKEQLDLPAPGDPTGAQVKVARYEPQHLELQTSHTQPGFLVLSEIYYRGWDAFIDGQRVPVERVNYALRGLSVPAGQHRVEFIFRSPSFRQGLRLAALGVLILLIGAIAGRTGTTGKFTGRMPGAGKAKAVSTQLLAHLRTSPSHWLGLLLLIGYFAWLASHTAFGVGGSDSSGYANIARSLLRGPLRQPVTELTQFDIRPEYAEVFSPLAYLTIRHPDGRANSPPEFTPLYPVGFPLHEAVGALLLGWNWGPFLVNPLLATLSLWLIFLIARQLGLPRTWAGASALLLACNPTFFIMSAQPMSDNVALFWGLVAVYAGMRARTVERWAYLAGAAFGMAVLVRPTNVLFLVPVVLALPWRWSAWWRFGAGGVPQAAIFCAYNLAAYGHPLQTGYGQMGLYYAFKLAGTFKRLGYHIYHLGLTMNPLVPLGWLVLPFARQFAKRDRLLVWLWFGVFLALYGFYDIYQDWGETRFLLPGYPGLILGAVLTTYTLTQAGRAEKHIWRTATAVLLFGIAVATSVWFINRYQVTAYLRSLELHPAATRWADAQLPRQSLVVSMEMSGTLEHYTQRPVLRWDLLPPDLWPELYRKVQARGWQLYALLMDFEFDRAQGKVLGRWQEIGHLAHFGLYRIEPLDKSPPRVEFISGYYGWEQAGDRRWQWVGGESVARLLNTAPAMRLRLAGDLPAKAFQRPSNFKVLLNGALLDEFAAAQHWQREYTLSAAQLGSGEWSELRVLADQSISPRQADPNSTDERQLSFSLTELVWEESALPAIKPPPKKTRQE
jgi:hypothetical protein